MRGISDVTKPRLVFQAGVCRMGHWALVNHFVPSVADCLDNFGSVQPKHRDTFKRRYEADGNLSVEAQSQRLGYGGTGALSRQLAR